MWYCMQHQQLRENQTKTHSAHTAYTISHKLTNSHTRSLFILFANSPASELLVKTKWPLIYYPPTIAQIFIITSLLFTIMIFFPISTSPWIRWNLIIKEIITKWTKTPHQKKQEEQRQLHWQNKTKQR